METYGSIHAKTLELFTLPYATHCGAPQPLPTGDIKSENEALKATLDRVSAVSPTPPIILVHPSFVATTQFSSMLV